MAGVPNVGLQLVSNLLPPPGEEKEVSLGLGSILEMKEKRGTNQTG